MAKVKFVITHEEFGDVDTGDVPVQVVVDGLSQGSYSLSDFGGDWRVVKYEVDGKEYIPEK